ncbi:MAG TPA: hypothetical protein GX528_00385 [Firmicutes bacterium]|nr:hypothetical protein [Bacillota bacterium]
MPSLEDMQMVGETCSRYEPLNEHSERSCANCHHWQGEKKMCELDIYWSQFTSLDQT